MCKGFTHFAKHRLHSAMALQIIFKRAVVLVVLNPACTRQRSGLYDIQHRRRRNQTEIDQLILEFQKSDLSPQEFVQNIGVHVQTVVRWLKILSVDLTLRSRRNAGRRAALDAPKQFVASEVRHSLPDRRSVGALPCDWPEIVAPSG